MGVTRFAALTTIASGVVAAIGVVLLVAMFAAFAVGAGDTGRTVGHLNDICVLVAYLLCAPSVIAMTTLLRAHGPVLRAFVTVLGLGSIAAIVALQWLLVTGAMTFEEQIGPAAVALWALGAWFIVTGYLGSRSGILVRGGRMGILAATYVGYPIWALWFGRILLRPGAPEASAIASTGAEIVLDR